MAKKPRLEAGGGAPGGDGVKKPAISMDALEKAKKALQLQKQLKEKMKNLPQLQKPAAPSAATGAASAGAAQSTMLAAAAAKAAQIAAGMSVPPTVPAAVLPGVMPGVRPSVRPPAVPGGFRPAPLRLDAQGREIDENGNLVVRAVQPVSTLKVNLPGRVAEALKEERGAPSTLDTRMPSASELEADPGFDPRMAPASDRRMQRPKKATFDFVQEGSLQKQAEMMRLRNKFGDAAVKRRAALPSGPIGPTANPNLVPIGDPNMVPIGTRRPTEAVPADDEAAAPKVVEPPPPEVEWWDRALLLSGSYARDVPSDPAEPVTIKEAKLTIYVEHPVPLEPPAEAPPPPPQPLKLTKKEMKKLRTQRRAAREKEKQDLIRQGLLEPPKPKIKIANLYRVLGEQAVADPTAMEKEARKQMAERQSAHEDRNLARKLLPEEKREKKLKKLFDDTETETITSVYKLARLDNRQHKFKVDINAKENHLTGMLLLNDQFCLVIVEGCPKSIKRFMKLMLRRIQWEEEPEKADDEDGDAMDEEPRDPNTCDLVWQGVVKQQAFHNFRIVKTTDAASAKALLESHEVGHYWDTAANYNRDEAPQVRLD